MFAELGKAPAYLLSANEIPPNPNADGDISGKHRWHSLDSEASYRKNPHPRFGPDDVNYQFNRHGYRCGELPTGDPPRDDVLTLACIGSSGLFGTGLPEALSPPALLQDRFERHLGRPVRSWNLSVGGTGADYVTRMLFSVIPVLKPDIVVLTTHPFNRREFMGETGRIYTTQSYPHWQHRFTDRERWQMHDVCGRISNPYNHVMHFLTNAKVWESLCDRAGLMWLFMSEGYSEHIESVYGHMTEPRKMLGPGMFPLVKKHRSEPATGLARDMLHGGILPNEEFADLMFARFCELYGARLNQLKRCA